MNSTNQHQHTYTGTQAQGIYSKHYWLACLAAVPELKVKATAQTQAQAQAQAHLVQGTAPADTKHEHQQHMRRGARLNKGLLQQVAATREDVSAEHVTQYVSVKHATQHVSVEHAT